MILGRNLIFYCIQKSPQDNGLTILIDVKNIQILRCTYFIVFEGHGIMELNLVRGRDLVAKDSNGMYLKCNTNWL